MRLREELEEYKRREQQGMAKIVIDKTTKEIEAKIEERQRRDEQLEREKEQRAMQLAIARENKKYMQDKQLQETSATQSEKPEEEVESLPPPQAVQARHPSVPQFDRSVKPQLTAYQQQVSQQQTPNIYALQQKQRDFSPIRGSVVSILNL